MLLEDGTYIPDKEIQEYRYKGIQKYKKALYDKKYRVEHLDRLNELKNLRYERDPNLSSRQSKRYSERRRRYQKDRYQNDPEYRERVKQRVREYRIRKKEKESKYHEDNKDDKEK